MSRGQRPTSSVLKLIRGTVNPGRLRDDRPKINELPRVPPGAVLSPDERAMWDWLMENVALPGVHGAGDGGSFVGVARLWVRAQQADAKVREHGLLMRGQDNRPMLQPYARISRNCWNELRIAFADIGATPAGRWKISGPRVTGSPGDAASWDAID